MKHKSQILECIRRAEGHAILAEFIEARCAAFPYVCAGSFTGSDGTPSLCVYDELLAKQEFGSSGWTIDYTDESGTRTFTKPVAGVVVRYLVHPISAGAELQASPATSP